MWAVGCSFYEWEQRHSEKGNCISLKFGKIKRLFLVFTWYIFLVFRKIECEKILAQYNLTRESNAKCIICLDLCKVCTVGNGCFVLHGWWPRTANT
jgi:hypothetical protein